MMEPQSGKVLQWALAKQIYFWFISHNSRIVSHSQQTILAANCLINWDLQTFDSSAACFLPAVAVFDR